MGAGYINERTKRIIKLIMSVNDYISLEQIAGELKLSKRSIYYEICKVNEWLQDKKLPEVTVNRGKCLCFDDDIKTNITIALEDEQGEENYIFSPLERVRVMICYIIISEQKIYIEELSDCCGVSRNTVFNDLQVVIAQLKEYELKLEYENKKGYMITGDCIRIRAIFFLYFYELQPLFENGSLTFINREMTNQYLQPLEKIERELDTTYVKGTLLALAAMMPIMLRGDSTLYFPDLKKDEICKTKEYNLIQKYFEELSGQEKIYLCLHLLGSRTNAVSGDIFADQQNQSVYEITKALIAEFEKTACVVFSDKEQLEQTLFLHIKSSMYRYRYGIQVGNPLGEDIIREYTDIFDVTKTACRYMEQQIGIPVSDGEIAYLALHFGAHLETAKPKQEKLRILIVCANGISTGNMVKHEVEQMLPQAEIVGVAAAQKLVNVQKQCDIIISSVRIKSVVPVIVVNPIMTSFDKRNVMNHPLIRKQGGGADINALFDLVSKYVPKAKQGNLRRELNEFFMLERSEGTVVLNQLPSGLSCFLSKENVLVFEEKMDWEQSVKNVGKCLVERGSIEMAYLDAIIERLHEFGPYMFITPGIILAHAKPEDGVKRLDIAIGIMKSDVAFSDTKNAKIIIVLAAEDQEKHLKIIKDIRTIFSVKSRITEMQRLISSEEVIGYILRILEDQKDSRAVD